jgi:hypothetical protein
MDTLTKENLLNVIKGINDAPYKQKLAKVILQSLPKAAAYGLAWEFYLKYYYEGPIIKVTQISTGISVYFTVMSDVYRYVKERYPKSNQAYIYDCLKGRKDHVYEHVFKYVTPDEI